MVIIEKENFSVSQICSSGQCFRLDPADETGKVYELTAGDRYLKIEVAEDQKKVRFYCTQEEFEQFWKTYFDLDTCYADYLSLIKDDEYLKRAAGFGSGIRILQQDLWEMIITFLISQQNNITRIKRCIENISREFGEKKISSNGIEYYAFPTPQSLSQAGEEQLKACNLGYRAKYVLDTARKTASGEISLNEIRDMKYKDARRELLNLYGVGEKVADCICLFGLHQLDAFPIDTHIRQALDAHYKRGFPNRRYKGCRGIIQQYIFYYELIKTNY